VRAIVRTADVAPLEGDGLVAVTDAELSALASRQDLVPSPDAGELRAHERITGRIHDAVPSLPSRFGQFFRDEAALAAVLRERRADLLAELDLVGGQAEMSVTLSWREPRHRVSTAHLTTGREFLEAKAAGEREQREAKEVVARLVDHLAVEQARIRDRICPRAGVAAIVAVLIARDGAEMLRRDVVSFEQRSSEVTARVYGPLPPYSFAS
jgi:hypothetical protein